MDWDKELYVQNRKPLENLVEGYSNTSVFHTMAFIGDSLSSGEFETVDADGNRGYYDMYEYSWGQYIARKNGLKAYNFSKGGMTARQFIERFAEENDMWNKEKACQGYVIALGVNDAAADYPEIGGIADIGNKDTFAYYYAEIIRRYKEISPDAKFFLVTIPNESPQEREEKRAEIRDLIYSFAEYFENTYVIDLYKYAPVYDEKFKKQYFMNGHMNPSGYVLTAKLIDSYIDWIISSYPDDFRTVGFIGKNTDEYRI